MKGRMRRSRSAASGTMSPRFGRMSEFAGHQMHAVPLVSHTSCLTTRLLSPGMSTRAMRGASIAIACGSHLPQVARHRTWTRTLTGDHVRAGPASDSQDSMYFDAEDELPASPSGSDGEAHGNDFVAAFSASLQRLTTKNRGSMNDRVRLRCLAELAMQLLELN